MPPQHQHPIKHTRLPTSIEGYLRVFVKTCAPALLTDSPLHCAAAVRAVHTERCRNAVAPQDAAFRLLLVTNTIGAGNLPCPAACAAATRWIRVDC